MTPGPAKNSSWRAEPDFPVRTTVLAPKIARVGGTNRGKNSDSICMVLHDLRGGGAERACLRLARGLVQRGRHVQLVLVRGEGAYLADIPAGVEITVLDAPSVLAAFGPLRRYLRARRPAAVFSALTHMNLVTVAAVKSARIRTRLVISERNQISDKARTAEGFRRRLTYRLVPLVYRGAHRIVSVSQGVADDLRAFAHLPKRKIAVIPNPVFDADVAQLAREEPSHIWFSDKAAPVILAVGRLHPQKGFDVLLRAFAHLRETMPARLIILGEGSERTSLLSLARQLGIEDDLSLPGFAANPFAFMARAQLFVLSSRWEGFPNALVEAMACGTPVVSTDCPSGPREILDAGGYGRLVPPDDARALCNAMTDALWQGRDDGSARRRAEHYSVEAAAERYLTLLEPA
jgi:glycosyltransferase involved in cell wall biosynthesis